MSEKQKSDCPGYYEVSGYTTSDGKKVDSYTRTCWKHGGGASGSGVQNTQESIDKTNEKLDEINNKIGREYGKKYPNIKREKLIEMLFNDWEKNRLYTQKILNKDKFN